MNLSDFATLALAQAYNETTYLDVDGGWLGQYFTVLGISDTIKGAQSNTTTVDLVVGKTTTVGQLATYLVETVQGGKDFGIDPSTNKGEYFTLIMGEIQSRGLMSASEHDFIFTSHTVISYPFVSATQTDFDEANDVGETLALAQNNAQHVLTINVTTAPRKPVQIKVQQRFGASALDLTEWHDCGQFQNVQYTQRSYQAMIAGSPAAYRELRLVSPLTLGVVVA